MFRNKVVFLAIGSDCLEQLSIVVPAFRVLCGAAAIVVYTDQQRRQMDFLGDDVSIRLLDKVPLQHGSFTAFGSAEFARLTQLKSRVIRDALATDGGWVLYCDTDVLPLKPFYAEVEAFMRRSHVFVSTEGRGFCPRTYCTGIIGVNNTPEALAVVDGWIAFHSRGMSAVPEMHDQAAFDRLMQSRPDLELFVDVLPEGVAMPGWYYDFLVPVPRHAPVWFHANWCVGNKEKCERLRKVFDLLLSGKKRTWREFVMHFPKHVVKLFGELRPPWSSLFAFRRI